MDDETRARLLAFERQPVLSDGQPSSSVASLGYLQIAGTPYLVVEFQTHAIYAYQGVCKGVWRDLLRARSVGQTLDRTIKKARNEYGGLLYAYTKLQEGAATAHARKEAHG